MNRRSPIHHVATVLVVAVTSLLILFPLYWMLTTSFKQEAEIFQVPPTLLPETIASDSFAYSGYAYDNSARSALCYLRQL